MLEKLEKYMELKRGYDLPSYERVNGNYPIVSSSGIAEFHNDFKVKGPGVVTGRSGTIGEVFFEDRNFWPLNTSLYVKDFKDNNKKFIYYFLKNLDFKHLASATAVPSLDRKILHSLRVPFIERNIQNKIAKLLSNYDDLIENNNKRIKLLEESAEELYKEWFVRLRFPNYQNTKIENGIPKGWEKSKLENYLEFFRGKSYSSADIESDEGLPFVNLKCINRNGGFRKDGLKVFNGKYKNDNITFSGDIMMAVTDMTQDRAIVGRVGRIPKMGFNKFIFSMDLIRIEPLNIDKIFLYSLLRFSNIGLYLKEFANGVNVLHLTPSILYTINSLIPSDEVQKKFSAIINPILEEIDILEQKNQTLKQTRDLLLPRLISGKLDIEKLEIN
ncbi:hypothetical protein CPG38_11050 [Malaciobacter marinus]|uniref:restriction endonuclease subunit S n=1 Tax=Malaciobacter marinus TaxID=505249 RepID=UPI000C074290|nr:restriction endonuclease subunit S [Malaciobacter marinus]PHO11799.1 hypothetical protein CPG38_11050 [Malaciobacter marinus]